MKQNKQKTLHKQGRLEVIKHPQKHRREKFHAYKLAFTMVLS